MNRIRYSLLFAALLMLALAAIVQAQPQTQPLTITPPSGTPGTNHTVIGTGLTPNARYTLEVTFLGAQLFAFDVTADANGQITQDLLTEANDEPGVYTVNITEGGALLRTGTITITAVISNLDANPLAYNQSADGSLTGESPEQLYAFEGAQGDIVTIALRSEEFDAFVALYGTDGSQLRYNDNALPPTDAAIFAYELPATGRYTLVATSREHAETGGAQSMTGAFSLTLSVARAAQEGGIGAGETVVGELGLLAQTAQYSFEGRGGAVVTVDLRSEAFDSVVRLFTADGTQVAQDDDGGGGLNARISRFRLPADGEYVIIVDGFRGFTGERRLQGKYTVTLEIEGENTVVVQATPADGTPAQQPTSVAQATPIPATATPIPSVANATGAVDFGETTIGELNVDAQTGTFTFTGTAGDVITIALDSSAFDPKVELIGPDGTSLASDDDSGPDLNALISNFTLPRDGEYTLIVDGFRGAAGDRQIFGQFSLTLTRAGEVAQQPTATAEAAQPTATPDAAQPTATPDAAQPTSVPPTGEAPVASSGSIESGQTVSGEFTESQQDFAYTFEGRTGDIVTIDLTSGEIDPLVRLIAPDGSVVAEDDDSGGGVQARIAELSLPADGTYTIEADAFRGIARSTVLGAFELTLDVTPAPVVEVQPTATPEATQPAATTTAPNATVVPPAEGEIAEISPNESADITFTGAEGEAFTFSFTGSAGDVVGFTLASDGVIDTMLEIVAQDGIAVASDDDSGEGFDPELLGVELPAYGGYLVTVKPVVPGATGTATLTFNTYIGTALGSEAISVTLNDKYGAQTLRFNGNAGETVRLIVTSTSQIGGAPEMVVSQGGETIASQILGQNLRLTFEFVTPADGRVDVKVLRDAGAYGEIQISVERVVEEEAPAETE